jgi:hypothetical protein
MKLSKHQLDTLTLVAIRGCVPGEMLSDTMRLTLTQLGLIEHVKDKGYVVTSSGIKAALDHFLVLSLR